MQINLLELWHSHGLSGPLRRHAAHDPGDRLHRGRDRPPDPAQNSATRARQFAAAVQGAMQAGAYEPVIAEVANVQAEPPGELPRASACARSSRARRRR